MTPTREEVIRVARGLGLGTSLLPFEEIGDKGGIWLDGDFNYLDLIERLAHHFYEAGAAAAPDLLFQLQAAANYIDALGGDSKSYRAAIAKATGEKT